MNSVFVNELYFVCLCGLLFYLICLDWKMPWYICWLTWLYDWVTGWVLSLTTYISCIFRSIRHLIINKTHGIVKLHYKSVIMAVCAWCCDLLRLCCIAQQKGKGESRAICLFLLIIIFFLLIITVWIIFHIKFYRENSPYQ